MLQTITRNISRVAVFALVASLSIALSSCFKEVDVPQVGATTGVIQIAPSSGAKNSILNISGTNFPDKSNIVVKVNGKTVPIVAATGNNLQVQIPVGTGSGKVEVTFGGTTYDAGPFTYINTYTVTPLTNGQHGLLDGPVATAQFEDMESTVVDGANNLYVADYSGSNNIRKINLNTGVVSTIATLTAGGGAEFLSADANNVYHADEGTRRITKISSTGTVTTLFTSPFTPQGIKVAPSGNIYISGSTSIAKFSPTGTLLWRLTSHGGSGHLDGDTSVVKFALGGNIEVDATETKIYVVQAQSTNSSVKVLDLTAKTMTTFAGSSIGFADGAAADAHFGDIYSITLDKTGGMYVADADNAAIRYIKGGQVSTVIGGAVLGDVAGIGSAAALEYPQHVSIDVNGNLYITDWTNNRIYKVVID
jgi:sugar lactone lactonase YvrE